MTVERKVSKPLEVLTSLYTLSISPTSIVVGIVVYIVPRSIDNTLIHVKKREKKNIKDMNV